MHDILQSHNTDITLPYFLFTCGYCLDFNFLCPLEINIIIMDIDYCSEVFNYFRTFALNEWFTHCTCFLMRDEKEERKKLKQARSNKQTRHSNTAHPRQLEKMSCLRWDSNSRHSIYTLDRALYQLSYRGSSAGWAQISHLIVHLMNRHVCIVT